jgi:peptide/nickel transport system permease protein
MSNYVLRRLIQSLPLLLGITLIAFTIQHLAPGDPAWAILGPQLDRLRPEQLERIRVAWGVDQPVHIQYVKWLGNLLHGDFGRSFADGRPVLTVIAERVPATLALTGSALLLALLISIPVGAISALRQYSLFDQVATVFTLIFYSIPSFWLALLMILVFAVALGWLPSAGMRTFSADRSSLDLLKHLVLPCIALATHQTAHLVRYTRSQMLEVLHEDFVRTARSKGLTENTVAVRHVLRNALLPLVTILGLSLQELFGGTIIIETIFAWPGIGRLGYEAALGRNYTVLMGTILVSGSLIVIGNLVADIMYAWADPRIRLE